MNINVYKQVGIDYHDKCSPIVSDGKKFFALDLLGQGNYGTAIEVADENGGSLDDRNIRSFRTLYEKKSDSLEYSVFGYIIL